MAPIAMIGFDERALIWLAARCANLPAHQVAIDDLMLPLGLVIDRVVSSRAELARIAPRDVMLLDQSPIDAEGVLTAAPSVASRFLREFPLPACTVFMLQWD